MIHRTMYWQKMLFWIWYISRIDLIFERKKNLFKSAAQLGKKEIPVHSRGFEMQTIVCIIYDVESLTSQWEKQNLPKKQLGTISKANDVENRTLSKWPLRTLYSFISSKWLQYIETTNSEVDDHLNWII